MGMKQNAKEAILKKLTKTKGEEADAALEKEANKIYKILNTDTKYEVLSRNLGYLELIAPRVADQAVTAAKVFLERLPKLDLTYDDTDGIPPALRSSFTTEERLISLSLKALDRVIYHQPERVMNLAYTLVNHEDETIAKQAKGIFLEFSKYVIDVFYGDGKTWGGLGT